LQENEMKDTEIVIRTATIEDSKSICDLANELDGYFSNFKLINDRLKAILSNPQHCIFLAEKENEVIGWIHGCYILRVESDPFVEIGGMVVSSEYRRKGIGKKLVFELQNWSEKHAVSKLRVRCNVNRLDAHNFYENLKFIETKTQKVFDK
jgi:GNAT superfamily N-acetyltransferase